MCTPPAKYDEHVTLGEFAALVIVIAFLAGLGVLFGKWLQ